MWRYLVGALGALLLAGAGIMLFDRHSESARADAAVPLALASPAQDAGADAPATLPEASEKTREQKRFDRYDKDRDAAITREEYLAPRRKAFAKLDANGDGRLSFEEWAVKTTTRFADADKDRSGTLTASEFATTGPKRKAKPACICPSVAKDED